MAKVSSSNSDSPRKRVSINKDMTIKDLARILGLEETFVAKYLYEELQTTRTNSQIVEVEVACQLARSLGFVVIEGEDFQ